MREILDVVDAWRASGHRVAMARVVNVEGSGPRLPGAAMAVNDEGEVVGSVSGGCVEGAVVTDALALLEAGGQGHLVTFGYSDDEAFAVGLTCGGTIHLFVEALDWWAAETGLYGSLREALGAGASVALVTEVKGDRPGAKLLVRPGLPAAGSLGDAELDRVVSRDALAELESGWSGVRHYGPRGEARQDEITVFIESFAPPPKMIIFGAVDFTAALARVAKVLGYEVTVCDARATFATPKRFPMADRVVRAWPSELLDEIGATLGPSDAVCVLTHDPRFDVPAIQGAVRTKVGYIGAMGSRRTHEKRLERLREVHVPESELARLHAPIGLDLGARTPEETAISICAEIIALHTGRRGGAPLRETSGSIHESPALVRNG